MAPERKLSNEGLELLLGGKWGGAHIEGGNQDPGLNRLQSKAPTQLNV